MTDDRRTYWTARELLAEEFPAPRWAVPGIIPTGLTLLAGAPKVGKSWLSLHLGIAVASGGLALGKIELEAGPVVMLALEDTGRRLQSRLNTLLFGEECPGGLHLHTYWQTIDQGGFEALDTWCERVAPRLVIVDVLKKLRPASGGRDNMYEADYGAIEPLKELADRYDTAIVALHHTRKADAADPLDTVSGTQGLAGAADTIAVLRRSRGQADAELHVTGRDVDELEYGLSVDASIGSFRLLDAPLADLQLASSRRDIVEYLRAHDDASRPKDIADALAMSHDLVKKTLRRMLADGQITQRGRGRYLPSPSEPVPSVPESLTLGDMGTEGTPPQGAVVKPAPA